MQLDMRLLELLMTDSGLPARSARGIWNTSKVAPAARRKIHRACRPRFLRWRSRTPAYRPNAAIPARGESRIRLLDTPNLIFPTTRRRTCGPRASFATAIFRRTSPGEVWSLMIGHRKLGLPQLPHPPIRLDLPPAFVTARDMIGVPAELGSQRR